MDGKTGPWVGYTRGSTFLPFFPRKLHFQKTFFFSLDLTYLLVAVQEAQYRLVKKPRLLQHR